MKFLDEAGARKLAGKAKSYSRSLETYRALSERGSLVPGTVDWNGLAPGVWEVDPSSASYAFQSKLNEPVGAYIWGTLIVSNNGSNVMQMYVPHNAGSGGGLWVRDRYSSSNEFCAWQQLYTRQQPPTASEVGAAPKAHSHVMTDVSDWGQYVYSAKTSRAAGTFLAAPSGSDGTASFRKVSQSDLPNRSTYSSHGVYQCLGTATMVQHGDVLHLSVYTGSGYNGSVGQDRWLDVQFRTGNGSDTLYAGWVEYHLNGSPSVDVYVVPASATSYTFWLGKVNYSGDSVVLAACPDDATWSPSSSTSATLPSGAVKLEQRAVAYASDLPTALSDSDVDAICSSAGF